MAKESSWLPGGQKLYAGNVCYQRESRLMIDEAAILQNVDVIRAQTKGQLIAVVKENGYGLGLLNEYRILEKADISWFGVTSTREALSLRGFGCRAQILMMTPILEEQEALALAKADVVMALGSEQQAVMLRRMAVETGLRPRVHVKIDTGMGRYGFLWDRLPDLSGFREALSVEGAFSHLAGKPRGYEKQVRMQADRLHHAVSELQLQGLELSMVHLFNSRATMTFGDLGFDAVRAGTAILGKCRPARGLKEAVWLEAPIYEKLQKEKGQTISYQSQAVLKKDTVLGLVRIGHGDGVGIGYTDGHDTLLHGVLSAVKHGLKPELDTMTVQVRGRKLPVVGKLGVAHMMVDLTGSEAAVGDRVRVSVNPLLVSPFAERYIIPAPETGTNNKNME